MKEKIFFHSNFFLFSLGFFFSITSFSCKNSMQTMIDDYNSHFTPAEAEPNTSCPGDEGFLASNMLFSQYIVCQDGTVNLSAPISNSYLWEITNKEGIPIKNISFYQGAGYRYKDFRFHLPKNKITAGSYTIRLTVTDQDENIYQDSCLLIVYEKI